MGQIMLLLVAIGICVVGAFTGKLIGGRAAALMGVVCWCLALIMCHHAGTLHGLDPLFPTLGSFALALLGLGLVFAAGTAKGPGDP